jgi:hypothetical protein
MAGLFFCQLAGSPWVQVCREVFAAQAASRPRPSQSVRPPGSVCGPARLGAVKQRRVKVTGYVMQEQRSVKQRRVKVTGYVMQEQRSDGSLVLSPALTVAEILARHGEGQLPAEEFKRHFGHLPADGEG